MKAGGLLAYGLAAGLVAAPSAQAPQGSGVPAASAQSIAPVDLTGYWVSIVNEDWRWRMVTPPKGDYASVPLSPEGRAVADKWTPDLDGRCEAYGAAGLMRMPTRVHITWQDENTLKVETDAGSQTRLFHFVPAGSGPLPSGASGSERSLQGWSVATWEFAGGRGAPGRGGAAGDGRGGGRGNGARGGDRGGPPPPRFGSLKVVTTRLREGWLRRNGVPYSESTTLTEYYDRFRSTNGDEWFFVTTVVDDPKYLAQEFVTSTHFKKEPDGSKWHPTTCRPS
jgi:hypothetical protein